MTVRPSSLQLAERCGLSAVLGSQHPEGSGASEAGTAVDAEISADLSGGAAAKLPAARALVAWARSEFGAGPFIVQQKVRLEDPETGALITEGTPDLVVPHSAALVIIDWKSKGQRWAGYIPPPDEALQQLAYGLAASLERGASAFLIIQAFFDDAGEETIETDQSRVVEASEWQAIFDRIAAIQVKEPIPTKGRHCAGCYPRRHCPAWMAPVIEKAHEALAPFSGTAILTPERACEGLRLVKAMREMADLAEGHLRTYADEIGGIPDETGKKVYKAYPTKGSRRVDSEALKAAGLYDRFTKIGAPSVSYGWRNADNE